MSQSLCQNYLHVVFSTKDRAPSLTDRDGRHRLHAYLAQACHRMDSPAIAVGGVEDHVHILCRLSKNLSVVHLIRELKRESSKWVKSHIPAQTRFAWQAGYGAFSISPNHVATLTRYIGAQERHHRTSTFQEEFRRLCEKYSLTLEEKYAWE